MSFMSDYRAALKKLKEQEENDQQTNTTVTSSQGSFMDRYYAEKERLLAEKEEEEDIAPVMTVGTLTGKEEDEPWYKSGLFADGYDFGDISKTILGLDKKNESVSPSKNLESLLTVYSNDDFKAKSGYVSTAAEGFWDRFGSKYGMGYNDLQYEYINNQNGIRGDIDAKAASWGADTGKTTSSYKEKALDFMTEEEVAVYNYYYQTEGKDKAEEFLDALAETLNARKAGKTFDSVQGNTTLEILSGFVAGNEQFEQGVKNLGNMIVGKDDYIPQTATQILTGKIREDLADDGFNVLGSSVGQMAFDAISTGTNMIPSIAVGAVNPVAGAALMGASAAGNAYQQDLNEGNDKGEAMLYATTIGVLEGALQYALGGIGKLGGTSATISRAVSGIKNGALKFALEYGGKIASEGLEEGLQEVLDPIVKNVIHGTDEEVDWENVAYSALLGGVMGGVFGASEVSNTTLNKNETAVVEKVFNDLVAESETDGKKLTNREKNKLYDSVVKDMERGYISTDTIEDILGDKSSYDALSKEAEEYDTLYNTPSGQLSKAQQDRLTELDSKNKANPYKDALNVAKDQYSQSVFELVKGDRLSESYNEKGRRSQVFEADLTQYDAKQQAVIQKAIDSGVLNNTNRTHELVDMIAKISADKGVPFDFTNNEKIKGTRFAVEGKIVNGYKTDSGITLNIDSPKYLESTVGHEITHVLEGTELYSALQQTIFDYAKSKGEYDSRLADLTEMYKDIKDANVEAELTADLVGDYLFQDSDFINRLSTENRNVFQKIYDEIKYLCKVVTAGSKEARELEKVKRAFEKAYREGGKTTEVKAEDFYDSETKYSLSVTDKDTLDFLNNQETVTTYKTMQLVDGKLYPPMASRVEGKFEDYSELGAWEQATEHPELIKNGNKFKLDKGKGQGSIEAAYNPYMHSSNLVLNDQFSGAYKRNNLVTVECEVPVSELTSGYHAEFAKDSVGWHPWHTGTVAGQLRNAKGTERQVLLSRWIKPVRIVPDSEVAAMYKELLDGTNVEVPDNVVTPSLLNELKKAGVKIKESGRVKYSLSDSNGKQLTKEQQDYFKDSKMRDENGSLKVMYHGTPDGEFTVFRDGTYFTDSKEYADRYQNPSASSISTGKVASTPKTFEVYLDIKKPFDINDAEARNIYINDYIKGGNAMGINPYLSDAEYAKINSIDWTEGEDLREFLIENEYDYDGLVLDEGGTGGYGDEVQSRGKSYVVFSPEQVKNVDNANPSADPDIRFSLSEAVEETKDLMALHNLHSNELLKQLKMGGMAYPSIAITKPEMFSHDGFGEVSVILHKDAIDPKKSKYNKIYSADAYTPTFPNVDYEASEQVAANITSKVNELYDKLPEYYQRSVRSLRDYANIDDQLNRWGGEQRLVEKYADDYGMKQLYLAEKGEVVPVGKKTTETRMTDYQIKLYQTVADTIGEDVLKSFNEKGSFEKLGLARMAWLEKYGDSLKDIYAEDWSSDGTMTKEEAMEIANDQKPIYWKGEIDRALKFIETGGVTVTETDDIGATQAKIDKKIEGSDYKRWIENLFSGIEGQSGIRNSKDIFTPSGNRRSFAQTHDPLTVDNIVKAMRKENQTGQGAFGGGSILGASAKEFGSIAEVKRNAGKLGMMDKAEHDAITDKINDTFWDIARRYANGKDIIDAQETIAEAVSKNESKAGIARYLKQYDYVYQYTDAIGDEIIELRDYIRSLPTPYFEAKPRRGVGFDEVAAFVIPYDADVKLKKELLNRGYNIAEYDPKVDGDRQRVVNQFEEYKFSLSDVGEQPRRYGDRATLGKDVAYAPVQEEAAPITENATPNASPVLPNATVTQEEMQGLFPDNLAPTQTELNNLLQQKEALEAKMLEMGNTGDFSDFEQVNTDYIAVTGRIAELEKEVAESEAGRIGSLDDADVPPEMEAPYPGESNEVTAEDPFADRSETAVGNRSVKAYQYENPEVKPFFREAAYALAEDIDLSIPAERWYNDDLYYASGGEKGFGGNSRLTAKDVGDFKDEWKCSWDDLREAVNDIIEDNGKENNALSKRVEFLINDRLMYGYTNIRGERIEPNQAYLDFLKEKQINEYSKEAREAFFANADQYAPAEDIAPVKAPTAVSPYDSMGAAPYGFDPITELQYKYGNLPDGEHPVREDSMPKSITGKDKVSLTARTVKGAGATPDEFVDLLHKETLGGRFSYIPIKNSDTVQKAYDEIVKKGWEAARGEWEAKVRRGEVSAELTATGSLLLNHAAKAGDRTAWLSVLHDYQIMGTNAGQAIQAMRILKTLTPDDSLYMIERSVEQMVEDMKLGTEIVIDDNLKQNYLNAKTDGDRDAARKALAENIAKQIPSTAMDKWTALRYLNMLGNFRTQVRNIIGNLGMSVTTGARNAVATGIEWLANKASGGKFHRTKSIFVNKDQLKAARNDFANVEFIALNGGKFNDPMAKSQQFHQEVQDARRIFKFAPLEGYRRGTNWAMDKGDLVFSKAAYGRALAGYLKANGIKETDFSKIDQKTIDEARAYAINEAQETTFRDNNWLSSWVSKLGRGKNTPKGVKIVSEGVMPFRKTPANILLRAEEYSPLGIVNATVKSIQAAKGTKNVTGADVVNSWAKALTGTGLFALGMWLNNSGMLSGGPDEDDDKDWFETQYGWQNYAIQIGDNNYTIDFLSPAAMPLLMGAQLNELRQTGGVEMKDLEKALLSIADPMIEMSMLQGVNDTLDNIRYAESNMGQFLVNACVSYLTQGLTNSFLGQLERSFEGQRMSTFTDKDSDLPAWLQKALGKASAKIPGWDYNQIPYVDAWGEMEDIAPLPGLAENALSPSYISQGITDKVYEELNRLNDAQSDINVYPQTPDKTVTFDDAYGKRHENYNLSAEEYVELAQMQGQTQKELVEDILSNYQYSGLTDKEKARAVQLAYQYAKEYSRQEILGADGFSSKWMEKAAAEGDLVNAIIAHTNEKMTFAYENPEKYQFFTDNGISWEDYDSADENKKREYSNMYTWVSDEDHPGRYSLAKAVTDDFHTFWQFKNEINDIKDNNDSDSGTKDKDLVTNYIFGLDIDYGQQIILYKSLYDSKQDKADYNMDIVDYLNSREDISYEDMETILKELGFTVYSDGTVTWD